MNEAATYRKAFMAKGGHVVGYDSIWQHCFSQFLSNMTVVVSDFVTSGLR